MRKRWSKSITATSTTTDALRERNIVIAEMYEHGLYTFGGEHTRQAVAGLMDEYNAQGKEVIDEWENWPVSIYAFPRSFSEFALAIDTAGEFDNLRMQKEMSLYDRVLKLRGNA